MLFGIGVLLTAGAMFIAAHFTYTSTNAVVPRASRRWLLAVVALLIGAEVFLINEGLADAIAALAKTQGTAIQSPSAKA